MLVSVQMFDTKVNIEYMSLYYCTTVLCTTYFQPEGVLSQTDVGEHVLTEEVYRLFDQDPRSFMAMVEVIQCFILRLILILSD